MADDRECPNCRRLAVQVERLTARIAALEEELRRSKRQAAPFGKDAPKLDPKPPGRKKGHRGAFRKPPPPDEVSELVRVPLESCPRCGGRVERVRDNAPVYQTDLPDVRPVVRRFDTQRAWCPRCRRRVRSRHPQQTSDASGAAGSQVGPNALALAADLKHRLGVSFRRIVDLLGAHFRLRVTPGALAQASHRLADRGQPLYGRLQEEARASPSVHVDETGWRIAAKGSWLWTFATRNLTVYRIDRSRGHGVAQEVLGEEFAGTLVSDGLPTYDVLGVRRQLCLAHLLKRCREIDVRKTRGAVRFPRQVTRLLRGAMALGERRGQMSPHGFAVARGRLEAELDRLLRYHLVDPDNERLAAHLYKQRDHLFTFLYEQDVEPTNNLAERQLRPAVIARKLSAGNRTERGARTHAVLASLAATCRQRGQRFTELAAELLRQPVPPMGGIPAPILTPPP